MKPAASRLNSSCQRCGEAQHNRERVRPKKRSWSEKVAKRKGENKCVREKVGFFFWEQLPAAFLVGKGIHLGDGLCRDFSDFSQELASSSAAFNSPGEVPQLIHLPFVLPSFVGLQ